MDIFVYAARAQDFAHQVKAANVGTGDRTLRLRWLPEARAALPAQPRGIVSSFLRIFTGASNRPGGRWRRGQPQARLNHGGHRGRSVYVYMAAAQEVAGQSSAARACTRDTNMRWTCARKTGCAERSGSAGSRRCLNIGPLTAVQEPAGVEAGNGRTQSQRWDSLPARYGTPAGPELRAGTTSLAARSTATSSTMARSIATTLLDSQDDFYGNPHVSGQRFADGKSSRLQSAAYINGAAIQEVRKVPVRPFKCVD